MERQNQRFAAALVFGGIAFYFGLTHFNTVLRWASGLVGLCTPAVIGGIIAFLLNVPMTAIEGGLKKLLHPHHPEKAGKALRIVSLLLTFVCILVVVALAVLMLIPELRKSIMSVVAQIQESLPALLDYLYSLGIDTTWMEQQLAAIDFGAIDFKELAGQMLSGATSMLGTLVGVVSATISVLGNALFSTVIALYILIDKENLSRQCRKLLYAFVQKETADQIWHGPEHRVVPAGLFDVHRAVGLPHPLRQPDRGADGGLRLHPVYRGLPVLRHRRGADPAGQPPAGGALSGGLPGLWTVIAVLVGGAAFGVLGMIFFIPVMAVVYILLKETVNARIERQKAAAAAVADILVPDDVPPEAPPQDGPHE